jgi:hypothetical protein
MLGRGFMLRLLGQVPWLAAVIEGGRHRDLPLMEGVGMKVDLEATGQEGGEGLV